MCGLYASRPGLYSKALVSTFFPHLAYLIRRRDPGIVMAMAWRPHFVAYETWYVLGEFRFGSQFSGRLFPFFCLVDTSEFPT